MKIAPAQVVASLADPARWAVVLLYGEDPGLVRGRAQAVTRAVLGETTDPFRFSVLTRDEHHRLAGEVASMALGGGRRVLRVQDATDGLATAIDRLGDHRADSLLVLEAASLTPRSKLRAMAEARPDWAAVPCYTERAAGVAADIKQVLRAASVEIDADAVAFLTAELAGESGRRRAELEKLALYAAGTRVSLGIAQACCSAELESTLGLAVSAALAGEPGRCDALLAELAEEGATGPGLLAVLSNQVHRLLRVRAVVETGRSANEALRALQPPVFPSQAAAMMHEVQRWSVASLEALGKAIREADVACKRAGSADLAIVSRLLMAVASRRPDRG